MPVIVYPDIADTLPHFSIFKPSCDYLTGALPGIPIKQAYIPMIEGKEKRKRQPSKEGFLGVCLWNIAGT